jgi:uncharacterized membrane protein
MAIYNFYASTNECKTKAKDCLRGSWKQASATTALYLMFMLVLTAITVLLSIFVYWWLSIPLGIFTILFVSVLNYGYNVYCLNMVQEKDTKVSNLFAGFSKKFGSVLKLTIKKIFLYIFWLILLVVPFFIKVLAYSMGTLLLVDNSSVTGATALAQSKHIMTDNYGRYTKFALSFCPLFLLGILSVGIAFVWIAPYFGASKAAFYENLKTDF